MRARRRALSPTHRVSAGGQPCRYTAIQCASNAQPLESAGEDDRDHLPVRRHRGGVARASRGPPNPRACASTRAAARWRRCPPSSRRARGRCSASAPVDPDDLGLGAGRPGAEAAAVRGQLVAPTRACRSSWSSTRDPTTSHARRRQRARQLVLGSLRYAVDHLHDLRLVVVFANSAAAPFPPPWTCSSTRGYLKLAANHALRAILDRANGTARRLTALHGAGVAQHPHSPRDADRSGDRGQRGVVGAHVLQQHLDSSARTRRARRLRRLSARPPRGVGAAARQRRHGRPPAWLPHDECPGPSRTRSCIRRARRCSPRPDEASRASALSALRGACATRRTWNQREAGDHEVGEHRRHDRRRRAVQRRDQVEPGVARRAGDRGGGARRGVGSAGERVADREREGGDQRDGQRHAPSAVTTGFQMSRRASASSRRSIMPPSFARRGSSHAPRRAAGAW